MLAQAYHPHDFAAYQASFARQRFLVLGRQSAARIGVVSVCHLCRVVQCVLPLGRGKDYVRVVAYGFQGAEFDAETLQFTSSCKLSDVKRGVLLYRTARSECRRSQRCLLCYHLKSSRASPSVWWAHLDKAFSLSWPRKGTHSDACELQFDGCKGTRRDCRSASSNGLGACHNFWVILGFFCVSSHFYHQV